MGVAITPARQPHDPGSGDVMYNHITASLQTDEACKANKIY